MFWHQQNQFRYQKPHWIFKHFHIFSWCVNMFQHFPSFSNIFHPPISTSPHHHWAADRGGRFRSRGPFRRGARLARLGHGALQRRQRGIRRSQLELLRFLDFWWMMVGLMVVNDVGQWWLSEAIKWWNHDGWLMVVNDGGHSQDDKVVYHCLHGWTCWMIIGEPNMINKHGKEPW